MEEIARGDVEILVHTTAPSHGQDDARYRSLAQAYLDFEPTTSRRLNVELQTSIGYALDGEADDQLEEGLLHYTQDERESKASYRPSEEEDSGSKEPSQYQSSDRLSISCHITSSQLSFQSVLDNVDSPAFLARTPHHEQANATTIQRHTQSSAGSWRAPPSTIADSQPDYDRNLASFSSPSRVLETYLQNQTRLDASSPVLPTHRAENVLEIQPRPASKLDDIEDFEDTGIYSSPSHSKQSTHSRGRVGVGRSETLPTLQNPITPLQTTQIDPISEIVSSSPPAPQSTPLASQSSVDQLVRRSKRQRVDSIKPHQGAFTKITKINMIADVTSSMVSNTGSSDWSDALEVRPSPPRTSTAELTGEMLITDSLRQLMNKVSGQGQYPFVPLQKMRELRDMERGYWLVNCEKWDSSIRSRCWDFLGKYVGRDLAGWGVSCIRDAETRSIRAYCWGIIAEHIYLLLHMASASKLKGTGARWISGDGTTIITMPS